MPNYNMRVWSDVDADGNVYWSADYFTLRDRAIIGGGGDTALEAVAEAEENLQVMLEYWKDEGEPIPPDDTPPAFSGKFALRMPRSVHEQVTAVAEREDVSVNTLILSAINFYLGAKTYENFVDSKKNVKLEKARK